MTLKLKLAMVAVTLLGCAPPCIGESGADYYHAGKTCAEWKAVDSEIVSAIKAYTNEYKPKFAKNYLIVGKDVEKWYSEAHGVNIAGSTDCGWQVIYVGSSEPHQGALTHELLHALNNCERIDGDDHHNWAGRGYEKVLNCIRGVCQ